MQQVWIVIGDEHAGDQDTENLSTGLNVRYSKHRRSETYVEDKDTPEYPPDGLSDVSPWAFSLGSGTKGRRIESLYLAGRHPRYAHSDELHALKAEGSLNNDGQDRQEPVGTDVVDQPGTSDCTRVFPVLEPPSSSVRTTAKGDHEAGDDEPNNQGNCRDS